MGHGLPRVRLPDFRIFEHVPPVPRTLFQVAATFGFTRETNFSPLFEMHSEPVASDLAYTSLPLDPHTDNLYRWPVSIQARRLAETIVMCFHSARMQCRNWTEQ